MECNKIIGYRIANTRSENKETQQELADYLGIKREQVAYIERGTRAPKVDQIISIADHYGVSCNYLLGKTDLKTPNIETEAICIKTGLSEDALKRLAALSPDRLETLSRIIASESFSTLVSTFDLIVSECMFLEGAIEDPDGEKTRHETGLDGIDIDTALTSLKHDRYAVIDDCFDILEEIASMKALIKRGEKVMEEHGFPHYDEIEKSSPED